MTENTLTAADLQQGRNAAEAELQEARAAHAKCAYEHALNRDDVAARKRLIAAKERLDVLQAEIVGLDAARGEATRREQATELEAQARALDQTKGDAIAAVDAVQASFAKAAKQIQALGASLAELQELDRNARVMETKCGPDARGEMRFYSASIDTRPLIEGLMWLAMGNYYEPRRMEIVMTSGGERLPDNPARLMAKHCEKAKAAIDRGTAERIEALHTQTARLRPAA